MLVSLCDLPELKEKLSKEFWLGNRWVAFDNSKPCITIKDIKCFSDLKDARIYCEYKATIGQLYLIKALASILKVFNGGFGWQNKIAATKLSELVGCFPISPFRPEDNLISSLLTGEYYPVIWSKIVYPLSVTDSYHIVEFYQPTITDQKVIKRIVFTSDNFIDALKRFNKQTSIAASEGESLNSDLLLIGKFHNQPLKLDATGVPKIGTVILLYTAKIVFDRESQCNSYTIGLAHDISLPLVIKGGVIVKYNIIKGKLDFFDSSLKKVQPAETFDYFDLTFFAYQQPIKVIAI